VIAVKSVSTSSTYKKGDVARAVIVRTKKGVGRKDGSYLKFADNAVALINKDNEPIGKRIFGPVARELREAGFKDVATLAEEVI
jgi:large subunit ribosomal protein L14